MDAKESADVVEFIKLHNIFTPNGTSLVKDIEVGDVVVLGRQPCLVTGISDPFSTTSPLDLDESNNPKVAVQITGQSVFWPDIDYEACFLLKDGNKIGTLGGPPDICERVPISIEGNKMKVRYVNGQVTSLVDIPKDIKWNEFAILFAKKHRIVVKIATYMGVVWACRFFDYGLSNGGGGPQPGTEVKVDGGSNPVTDNTRGEGDA